MARTHPTNTGNLIVEDFTVTDDLTVTDIATVGDISSTTPEKYYFFEDDFVYYYRNNTAPWYTIIGSNGAQSFVLGAIDTTDNPGLTRLITNDTVGSYATMSTGAYGSFMLGGGVNSFTIIAKINNLSVAGDVTFWAFGARYASGGGSAWSDVGGWDDALMFVYDKDTGNNWLAVTRKNGTETATDTGIAVDTDFHKFEIIVNAGATSVGFKIDGTTEATNTTNIPDDLNLDYTLTGKRISETAVVAQEMQVDYFSHKIELTNTRY